MRLRSAALPVAIACAAALALPSAAQSATTQCSIVMPSKVVVAAATVTTPIRVASNCAANDVDSAHWGLEHPSGAYTPLDFVVSVGDTAQRLQWYDDDPMGTWTTSPEDARAAGTDQALVQNTASTRIKYASRISAPVKRTTKGLSWSVSATQWSGRAHAYVGRPHVVVTLFHRTTGSTAWTYVKSVRTTSTGRATVSLGPLKAGSYRLAVKETATVWASYSSSVRGKI